jgi:hypothetical protein
LHLNRCQGWTITLARPVGAVVKTGENTTAVLSRPLITTLPQHARQQPHPEVTDESGQRRRPLPGERHGGAHIRRQDVWAAVAACGATPEKGVTKRTTVLVVGDGFTGDNPADFHTGKAAKAVLWRSEGHRIEVRTEADLSDLLDETQVSGTCQWTPA